MKLTAFLVGLGSAIGGAILSYYGGQPGLLAYATMTLSIVGGVANCVVYAISVVDSRRTKAATDMVLASTCQ